jgi:hypothetical protein
MINVWLGARGLCWLMANQFWVSNSFNFARIAFWTKESREVSLEGYDLAPTLG